MDVNQLRVWLSQRQDDARYNAVSESEGEYRDSDTNAAYWHGQADAFTNVFHKLEEGERL